MNLLQILISLVVILSFLLLILLQARQKFIPDQIRKAFRTAPVNRVLSIQDLSILSFTPRGVQVRFHALVLKSKPPPLLWFLEARAAVSTVSIADATDGEPIGEVRLSNPVEVKGTEDVVVRQELLEVDFVGLEKIKNLMRRVEIGGPKEADRITLRLTINVDSVHVWNYLFLSDLVLSKDMNVGKLRADAAAAQARYAEEEKAAIQAAEAAEAQAKAIIERVSKEEYEAEVEVLTRKYHAKRTEEIPGGIKLKGAIFADDTAGVVPLKEHMENFGTKERDKEGPPPPYPSSDTKEQPPIGRDDGSGEDSEEPEEEDTQPRQPTYIITDPHIPHGPLPS
ncbi:hypothetical protein HK097_010814, partial [Rhizophlyctis rosea]